MATLLTRISFFALMFLGLAGLIRQNEVSLAPAERELTNLDLRMIAEREALLAGVNPALIRSLIQHESTWEPDAVSHKGAIGLMQVMPANAKGCGLSVKELFEPQKNIMCGVKLYLGYLKNAGGNPHTAVQIYNGGTRCVDRCRESMQLAHKVLKTMAVDTK